MGKSTSMKTFMLIALFAFAAHADDDGGMSTPSPSTDAPSSAAPASDTPGGNG